MSNITEQEVQELADKTGFDLKKLPYGFQFRIGKIVVNYYNTTGTVVSSQPKQNQKVKKNVSFDKLEKILKKIKESGFPEDFISGEHALNLTLSGIKVNFKRSGEVEWREGDIGGLPLNSFLNKTFVFKIGG